jgi:hypothetical protein
MYRKLVLVSLLTLSIVNPKATGQPPPPPAAKSPLSVEAVEILPADPGPETLCQLRVKIRNGGTRKISALAFAVRLGGLALPVYQHQIYLRRIEPGTTAEVRLFNFWTTEAGRPAPLAPKDGRLQVEVSLTEARWVEVKNEGGAEVVTPGGSVPGLPVSAKLTVPLKTPAKKPA